MRVLKEVRARDLSSTPKKPLGSDIKITVVLLDSGSIESEGVFVETGNVAISKKMYPTSWFKVNKSLMKNLKMYLNQKVDEVLQDMKRQWKNFSSSAEAELVVVEDPFTSNPTYKRKFGEEPYKLNNGASIQICWLENDSNSRKNIKNGSIWSDSYGFEINSLGGSSSVSKSIYEKTIIVSPPPGLSGDEKDRITIVDGKIKGINKDKIPQIPSDVVLSYGSTFSGQTTDLEIINTLISKWKINVPNYDKLALINPTTLKTSEWRKFESEGKITIPTGALSIITDDPNYIGEKKNGFPTHGYKSPLVNNPPEEEKPKTEPPKENTEKIKISIQLPEGEVFKVKEDISAIIIAIGPTGPATPINEVDPEYVESAYTGPEEDYDAVSGYSFTQTELERPETGTPPEKPESQKQQEGVNSGGSKVEAPSTSVSNSAITISGDLAGLQNSNVLKFQMMGNGKLQAPQDILSPQGQKILGADVIKDMNQFITDVLGPFATFLKQQYPALYKSTYISSATRGYIPKGGSLTSQHLRGQAIDFQIIGANATNPGKNIELLNAVLEWYKSNKVGYGQILFETRGNSCWIHWSYRRGNNKIQLLRFKEDVTYSASANTTGKYVLPPLNAAALGFKGLA